jgi:23S rRNA (cytosine1962-C5)-methyltransferase
MTDLPRLRLKINEERRLREGHVWIFSNEVDIAATPLKAMNSGDQVVVEDSKGKALGLAIVNPNALICARLFNRDVAHPLSTSLFVHRLQIAESLREQWFDEPYYRLVYGDSDGLPGVVIDRFADIFVVQLSNAGMERMKSALVDAIVKVFKPSGVLFKNDGKMRIVEGLDSYVEVAYGEVPDRVALRENGVAFEALVRDGQKTGWFYDHRDARARLNGLVKGKRVLDVFSYLGGWGVQAAAHGASEVRCIDGSEKALDQLMRNATLNGVESRVQTLQGDAFEALTALKQEGERFDIVILDPPAFINRRKDHKAGLQAYRRINELGMRLLNRDGLLVSASCSMHLGRHELVDVIRASSRHVDRQAQIVHHGHQGADHPIHPAIPETEYLKSVFARVLPI